MDNAIFYASMFHAVKYVRLSEIFQMVRMVRKACGSFALMKAGDKPGDPEVEEPYACSSGCGSCRSRLNGQ